MLNIEQIDSLVEGSIVHLSTTREEWELSPITAEQQRHLDYCDFVGKCVSVGLRHNLMTGHSVLFNKEDLIIYNLGRYQKTAQNSPWISCKERMPNLGEVVFVRLIGGGHAISFNETGTFQDKTHFGELQVEAWMPIPE